MSRRSEAAFEAMMRSSLPGVRAYARSLSSSVSLVEEALQETYIRAWRYWPTFRNDAAVMPWLITICRHVTFDLIKKNRAHQQLPDDVIDTSDQFDTSAVNEMIRSLPLAQREVMIMCAILGFDYDTAARALGIPVGTVRSRLARARESLAADIRAADAV